LYQQQHSPTIQRRYVALQRAVQERYSQPPTQLEQQIYFTAAAQNWCMKEKQKEALLDIITEEHAPERVRNLNGRGSVASACICARIWLPG
jgi:predicted metalloendopeptidase